MRANLTTERINKKNMLEYGKWRQRIWKLEKCNNQPGKIKKEKNPKTIKKKRKVHTLRLLVCVVVCVVVVSVGVVRNVVGVVIWVFFPSLCADGLCGFCVFK